MMATIADLLGVTLVSITVSRKSYDNTITFLADDGREFIMFHWQNCCEEVVIEDICGDVNDLTGSPILQAEVTSNEAEHSADGTWTFYKLATINGGVTIRWMGTSNGCYGESVNFMIREGTQTWNR
jgi:hypothetical protein